MDEKWMKGVKTTQNHLKLSGFVKQVNMPIFR